jgi:hypothetical protein
VKPKPSLLLALLAIAPSAGLAQQPSASTAPARNDYSDPATWLCRPGRTDACAVNQDFTIVAADGSTTKVAFKPAANPPVDCFYVYPTVSNDPTPNSDMQAGPEEERVIAQQFARFAEKCRPFAPLYRQMTLTVIRAAATGQAMSPDRELAYQDVRDAWNHYLAHDNGGRGVVLIGHSQGSGVLMRLIRDEIEGKPAARQLVSAILAGTNVPVPDGADVGGAFRSTPLCRAPDQTGCVVAFASFRASAPPPNNSYFGRVAQQGMTAACTNPAALAGGVGELDAYLSSGAAAIATSVAAPRSWTKAGGAVDTPFVKVPKLLSAECVVKDGFSYLAVTVMPDAAGQRTDDIVGDVVVSGRVLANWGLHLIDVHLTMGNLLNLVDSQSKAWAAKVR